MSVVLAYKNFAANRNISHIGLGVAAINTAKVLQQNGIKTAVWPIINAEDLRRRLTSKSSRATSSSPHPGFRRSELQSLAMISPILTSASTAIRMLAFFKPTATESNWCAK